MVQGDAKPPRRIRLRSAYDPRWIAAMTVGLLLSLAYYGVLLWVGVSAVRWLVGL